MRYRVNWTEWVGYYAYIEANSPEEAKKLFREGPENFDPPGISQPDGYCEMQDDVTVNLDEQE